MTGLDPYRGWHQPHQMCFYAAVISAQQRQCQPDWRICSGLTCCVLTFCHLCRCRCDLRNKGISVLCNLKPKADFLNYLPLCSFVANIWRGGRKHNLGLCLKQQRAQKSAPQKALALWHRRSGSLEVYNGRWRVDWFKYLAGIWWARGGIWFCPPLINCKECWGEKQAVNSEEQCGIESRSADRPNPCASGVSCALSCMNGADCVNFLSHTHNVCGLFISLCPQVHIVLFQHTCCQRVLSKIWSVLPVGFADLQS